MLPENYHIVPIWQDGDMSTTLTGDSVNMKNYHDCTYILTFDTLGTASSVLTVCSGTDAAATTSALYFNYAFGGAAIGTAVAGSTASCDVLAAWTNANTLTITYNVYDNYMLVVCVDAASMDIANSEEWLTPVLTDPGSATGTVDCIALLRPRYKSARGGTALA
jgi:hypothetical protein